MLDGSGLGTPTRERTPGWRGMSRGGVSSRDITMDLLEASEYGGKVAGAGDEVSGSNLDIHPNVGLPR